MNHVTAAELRALRGRERVRLYQLAAATEIAPTTLSELLNEHRYLDVARAERIRQAIQELGSARSVRQGGA